MIDPEDAINAAALVAETRARREALRDLVSALRKERIIVQRMLAELPERPRLTSRQQDRLRAHLTRSSHRPQR